MNTETGISKYFIGVNCVVLGQGDNTLNVLLVPGQDGNYQLPGRIVRDGETLDKAARCVVDETTGAGELEVTQFQSFEAGDVLAVGYVSLGRIGRKLNVRGEQAVWMPVEQVLGESFPLSQRHRDVIVGALAAVRLRSEADPAILFNLLPSRFTALQLRLLCQCVENRAIDVRNFKKKMDQLVYVEALDEWEQGVSHRAARYYRFDRIKYKKSRRGAE